MSLLKNDLIVIRKDGTHFYLDGSEVTETEYRKRYPVREDGVATIIKPWSRAQRSIAMAVHPSQAKEAAEDATSKGVPTDFTADGEPEFRDRNHRKQYMKAYGFFDRDAGYGDQAPQQHKGERAPDSKLKEIARRLASKINVRRNNRTE